MGDHTSTASDSERAIAAIEKVADIIRAMPPTPRGIITHSAVPYGRAYRQWDTNGDMWMWANERDLDSLPRVAIDPFSLHAFGIPVYWSNL